MGILDKKILLFDIETDGLLDNLTKIHCLAYTELKIEKGEIVDSEIKSTSDVKEIKSIVNKTEVMLGHNIIQYDIPALKKLGFLNKQIPAIDTLGLSWYTQNTREKHGLEQYGEEFKIPKPKIADWKNLTTEEYLQRCEMDVRINLQLFKNQFELLKKIYGKKEGVEKLINYISFKLDCIREQEENPLRVDLEKARENMDKLAKMRDEKFEVLKQHMPNVIHYKKISKPSKPYKKDGSLSAAGIKWFKLLEENNLPEDYEDEVEIIHKTEESNPQSVTQLKDWLYSLGWKPDKFTERVNTKGEVNKVPQIYDGEIICNSIRNMFEEYPYLENLDMIGKIKHRYGIFKSFLSMDKEYVPSLIAGFTNTFRVKHVKPFANMPKVGTFFGAEIRGCIVTPENKLCCGSDCSALEDTTKQHYMYFFDPEYVKELRTEGFDPHLDVAVLSKLLTPEQAEEHKKGIKKYTAERNKAKTVNFCLPVANTEVLTIHGWKKYEDLKVGQLIFTHNIEKDKVEVKPILEIPFFKDSQISMVGNDSGDILAWCTPNHRWLCKTDKKEEKFFFTYELNRDTFIRVASNFNIEYNVFSHRSIFTFFAMLFFGKVEENKYSVHRKYLYEYKIFKDNLEYFNDFRIENDHYILEGEKYKGFLERINIRPEKFYEMDYSKIFLSLSFKMRQKFLVLFQTLNDEGFLFRKNVEDLFKLGCIFSNRSYTTSLDNNYKIRYHAVRENCKINYGMRIYGLHTADVFCANNENQTFFAKQGNNIFLTGNSGVYGAGPATIAKNTGMSLKEARDLHKIYWERNKAVKLVSKSLRVKIIFKNGNIENFKIADLMNIPREYQKDFNNDVESMWLFNPVSKLYLPFRKIKDAFSTCNQSTGVFLFDNWIREVRKRGIKVSLQYHDEILFYLNTEDKDRISKILIESMEVINKNIKLNVPLGCSMDYGKDYAEVH